MPKSKLVEIKTKENEASVDDFINSVPDLKKQEDARTVIAMMKKATKDEPKMWGSSIIGFGNLRYKSPTTGREVDWFKIGLSPRKAALTLYLGLSVEKHGDALQRLGKYKNGKGCLYINKLSDIDLKVLEGMIVATVKGK